MHWKLKLIVPDSLPEHLLVSRPITRPKRARIEKQKIVPTERTYSPEEFQGLDSRVGLNYKGVFSVRRREQ